MSEDKNSKFKPSEHECPDCGGTDFQMEKKSLSIRKAPSMEGYVYYCENNKTYGDSSGDTCFGSICVYDDGTVLFVSEEGVTRETTVKELYD